jgi:hypothetical protein
MQIIELSLKVGPSIASLDRVCAPLRMNVHTWRLHTALLACLAHRRPWSSLKTGLRRFIDTLQKEQIHSDVFAHTSQGHIKLQHSAAAHQLMFPIQDTVLFWCICLCPPAARTHKSALETSAACPNTHRQISPDVAMTGCGRAKHSCLCSRPNMQQLACGA